MFLVTGSQADRAEKNKITLLKLTDLNKTHIKAGNLLNIHNLYSKYEYNIDMFKIMI